MLRASIRENKPVRLQLIFVNISVHSKHPYLPPRAMKIKFICGSTNTIFISSCCYTIFQTRFYQYNKGVRSIRHADKGTYYYLKLLNNNNILLVGNLPLSGHLNYLKMLVLWIFLSFLSWTTVANSMNNLTVLRFLDSMVTHPDHSNMQNFLI